MGAIYNSAKRDLINGSIDLDTDTIKAMFVTSSYTPNIKTHTKRSDITNEIPATGNYVSGGFALSGKTVIANNTTDKAVFDADDIVINNATITARGIVLYKSRGGASSADELLFYLDFGSNITSTNGTFTVQFDANGIFEL